MTTALDRSPEPIGPYPYRRARLWLPRVSAPASVLAAAWEHAADLDGYSRVTSEDREIDPASLLRMVRASASDRGC